MSDAPQGPGWWQASDGRFYPPETAPAPPPPQWPPTAPQPQPQKSGGCLKGGLIVVGVLVALVVIGGVIAAISNGSNDDKEVSKPATTLAPGQTAAPTTADPGADVGSRENPVPTGTVHDLGEGWSLKVTSWNPDATTAIAQANPLNTQAPPGQVYVVVGAEGTYNGDKQTATIFDLQLKLVGSANKAYSMSDTLCVPPAPVWATQNEVFKGGTIAGNLCFAVPAAEVSTLELTAETLFGDKVFFKLG